MPAHVLLVHFVVVLVPLTALLVILCSLWPAARRHLVWLTLVLAAVTAALTPVTIEAGEWLLDLLGGQTPILQEHADRGGWMIYFSSALLLVAVAVAVVHVLERRSDQRRTVAKVSVAIMALAVGISSLIQVYRVGDSGSQAVWGGVIANLQQGR